MGLKSMISKPYAKFATKKLRVAADKAVEIQLQIMSELVGKAMHTQFGKDHHFSSIRNYVDFKEAIPVKDYEGLRPYIDRIVKGEYNILWEGRPIYFAETSGTTSGVKYIPITKESISNHINGARNALLAYITNSGNAQFVDGKLIFLSGSPILHDTNGIPTGRLSGIVNHHIPSYLTKNQMPSYDTNCVDDWEQKLDKIVEETISKDMTLISGIPPWMQMYFDRLIAKTDKKIKDIFPNFSVMVYGGVNFDPYKKKLFDSIGKSVDTVELYPASEGFIAFQDNMENEGLLLNTNAGIFYEFIPTEEIFDENPTRLHLGEVELDKNYALVINSNAGLWGYLIGDTVKFISLQPYRINVTGRIKHFISAFGEHVIGEEVDWAIAKASEEHNVEITEFTIAPMVVQGDGQSYHEWFIEFTKMPENLTAFVETLDNHLRSRNEYYDDLIKGNILQKLHITPIQKDGFINYMKSIGKLGGQNKLPRLSNDRKIAEAMEKFKL
ncbi:GH3 auxin-responsive promoter family protein [Rhizosphaericola mali]|uniref:GH3 auxin-responsive promoter family protein n=2 Tax=Rhizosphaericola mali TaxID=2545455 RepID=A0A5P2G9E2_9BACT|nr:GH3 auxin-responsive promoter family protein [Rhizosphaericola mali]